MSAATAVLAPVLFVGVWLRLGKMAISLFISGIWALGPRDDIERDGLGPLPTISEINALLFAEDFQTVRLTQEDRALLGRNGRFTPRAFIGIQRKLRLPARLALQPLLRSLFLGVITLAVLIGLLLMLTEDSKLLIPSAIQVGGSFAWSFGIPSILLEVALLFFGVVTMIMDLRFARALAPRRKPSTEKTVEILRELTSNATPVQLLSVLKSELRIRLKQVSVNAKGRDGSRDGFVDQSSFFLEILVEGESTPIPNPALGAATRRLWVGAGFSLFGAVMPLFFLLPSSVQDLLRLREFSLSGTSSGLIWILAILAAGSAIRNLGKRAMADAEVVLNSEWQETSIAAIRIDGTVNTQTALTGRALDDSYGAENRIQQSRYDARLMTCALTTVAPVTEAHREIICFSSNALADGLHRNVFELLREEGSKSTISAIKSTIDGHLDFSLFPAFRAVLVA